MICTYDMYSSSRMHDSTHRLTVTALSTPGPCPFNLTGYIQAKQQAASGKQQAASSKQQTTGSQSFTHSSSQPFSHSAIQADHLRVTTGSWRVLNCYHRLLSCLSLIMGKVAAGVTLFLSIGRSGGVKRLCELRHLDVCQESSRH